MGFALTPFMSSILTLLFWMILNTPVPGYAETQGKCEDLLTFQPSFWNSEVLLDGATVEQVFGPYINSINEFWRGQFEELRTTDLISEERQKQVRGQHGGKSMVIDIFGAARFRPMKVQTFKGKMDIKIGSMGGARVKQSDGSRYVLGSGLYISRRALKNNLFGTLERSSDWAIVIAHEMGHHIQDSHMVELILAPDRNHDDTIEMRSELQADCLAGVWLHHHQQMFSSDDIQSMFNAARRSAGEGHGDEAQRVKWMNKGFQSGSFKACDTYSISQWLL